MKRFSEAEAGDLVYCRLKGAGFITYTNIKNDEIRVRFQPGANVYYDCAGRKNSTDIEPMLFYRSSTDNYLIERPEPEVDWSTVKMGTLISVSDLSDFSSPGQVFTKRLLCYLPQAQFPFWAVTSISGESAVGYKYAKLLKETPTCQKA